MSRPDLQVILANPRGFCAGVVRALETVEAMLRSFGSPIFVHHDIVHNPHVVESLRRRGVVFVESPEEAPEGAVLIVSAHGAAPSVYSRARARGAQLVDATCPLVTKVHREVEHAGRHGRHVILIGHRYHAETVGTAGHAKGTVAIVETAKDAELLPVDPQGAYVYVTQTTLSPEDTDAIVAALRLRIPDLVGPPSADICFATSNRQAAVRAIASTCDTMVVIGGGNSSNTQRLVEVARRAGCPRVLTAARGGEIDLAMIEGARVLGLSSGASTPEEYVEEFLERLHVIYRLDIRPFVATTESERFNLPPLPVQRVPVQK